MGEHAGDAVVTKRYKVEGERVTLFSLPGILRGRVLTVDGIPSRYLDDGDTTSQNRLMFEPINDHDDDGWCGWCSEAREDGTLIVIRVPTPVSPRKIHSQYRRRRRYW